MQSIFSNFRNIARGLMVVPFVLSFGHANAEGKKAPQKTATTETVKPLEIAPPDKSSKFDQATFKAIFAAVQAKRGPAFTGEPDETDLSPEYVQFRNEFLAIEAAGKVGSEREKALADQLESFINKYNTSETFTGLPADVKFVVTQLSLLQPYRSVIFRLRKLFDEESNNVHSLTVGALKTVANSLRVVLPTDQSEAIFAYLSVPAETNMAGLGTAQFRSVAEFQNFLASTVPFWDNAIVRTNALLKTVKESGKPIVFDNKMAFGTASFSDSLDRYRLIDSVELYTLLAAQHQAVFHSATFVSYNYDQVFSVLERLGRQTGLNGLPGSDATRKFMGRELGVSVQARVDNVIRRPEYAKFLTLRGNYGESTMKVRALHHLRESVTAADAAWQIADKRTVNAYHAVETQVIQAQRRELSSKHSRMMALVSGEASVKSPITGQSIKFDVPKFYTDPPKDLKAFLPIPGGFDTSPQFKSVMINGKKEEYRNYYRGRATAWNNEAFAKYVPSAARQDPGYMGRMLGDLAFSWEGDILFGPIYNFIQ